jgi:hypothetical protein
MFHRAIHLAPASKHSVPGACPPTHTTRGLTSRTVPHCAAARALDGSAHGQPACLLRGRVRAVVVDKDRQARWAPASWQDVAEEEVEAMFEELPAGLGLLLGCLLGWACCWAACWAGPAAGLSWQGEWDGVGSGGGGGGVWCVVCGGWCVGGGGLKVLAVCRAHE